MSVCTGRKAGEQCEKFDNTVAGMIAVDSKWEVGQRYMVIVDRKEKLGQIGKLTVGQAEDAGGVAKTLSNATAISVVLGRAWDSGTHAAVTSCQSGTTWPEAAWAACLQ
jgi:hypothetical protein